jgi:exopolyphosphatase/guanosine-5'-triphosphate,3'-diphosphate pyrophosphatase
MSMNKLIIEMGTNSIKCLSAQWVNTGWIVISDSVHPTRLGEGLAERCEFSEAAMQRNIAEIAALMQSHPEVQQQDIHLIATQSMRQAANSGEFNHLCDLNCGLRFEILTGEQEAQFSYLAVLADLAADQESLAVLDIGGGSTELAIGIGRLLHSKQSLSIGAVSLTERFITSYPVDPLEFNRLQQMVVQRLQEYVIDQRITRLVGVGGTLVTLLLLDNPDLLTHPGAGDAMSITSEHLTEQIALFQTMPLSALAALPGMPAGRADIILAGCVIALAAMHLLGKESISISTQGVRHGYLQSLSPAILFSTNAFTEEERKIPLP